MIKIEIKPLSVNDAWKGKRFKTPEYAIYENALLFMLPKLKMPEPPFLITLEFGFSSEASDWDNPVKPFQDILSKKYGFNDKHIKKGIVSKEKVEKGKEYVKFKIESITT
ncbi:hypothetical protein [Flavobacterium sp. 102]|uniref:hypothetical protein n=1 Tax=Flavobacterium sp. 102 TaxID=2135623 RepID=UPI000EB4B366|nr:hypothetical protein [Flavobacterium sp. 102]RKS00447.1 hypothetical protein C8C84_0057 [Flavobacterium sp. 102]